MPKVIACGSRQSAYEKFCSAVDDADRVFDPVEHEQRAPGPPDLAEDNEKAILPQWRCPISAGARTLLAADFQSVRYGTESTKALAIRAPGPYMAMFDLVVGQHYAREGRSTPSDTMKQALKPVPLQSLDRFGGPFASALRDTIGLEAEGTDTVHAWSVAQAKDHFSEVLDLVRTGKCQVLSRRRDEPLLMMSMGHLTTFVEQTPPLRRFADMIAHEPEGEWGTVFGAPFASALRHATHIAEDVFTADAWGVADAKGHFKQILDLVVNGQSQLVRRRREPPVLMTSIAVLADFAERAPKRRFAELFAYDPSLPTGGPLEISEQPAGADGIEI